ncbi:uncharacterized protein F5891DRAFT_979687 [Suillus fuscotomentosus]|uniref:CxC2-like cysteine cluster KDZ transposase-associated domain-containing protein n=1 Tax=Suillus fuscotomentosus TaxID=1912939 RepID=A0AAD4E7K7_9AGAM|nr:uncharacterized protein F5891DRAFT_979687 [Suillus fuscotomentosus]KAG1901134.1 hypothetical protein F5891DRAFT_979687 [Suillus fuscotomentosus]
MARTIIKECTPRGTAQLVERKPKKTTRGLKPRLGCPFRAWGARAHSIPKYEEAEEENKGKSVPTSPSPSTGFKLMPSSQGPNNYLREWKQRTEDYLDMFMARKAPHSDRHVRLPFHKISRWNGDFFEESSLTRLGMEYHLGHSGLPCPMNAGGPEEIRREEKDVFDNNSVDMPVVEEFTDDEDASPIDGTSGHKGMPVVGCIVRVTVVDITGIHYLIICFCQCTDAPDAEKQLFQMGLFPASFTWPRTTFTFALLDDFALDNVESGTSAMNYYNKLRRRTSSIFPHLVPDRYRELMRVARQWWQLKLLRWNGFAHSTTHPKPGELGLFCPTCPQPGINVMLPTEYNERKPRWLYGHSLVMDGNFKAEHLHLTNPDDEVWLMDGLGFMVGRKRYKAHLAVATDSMQRSECNNHRAVNQANASRHKLEATGIGGYFQKGERQMNMDYALCNALGYNTEGLETALTFYDVNCQYNKYLLRRVEESPYLAIPFGMEIILGIGLWHVHGHQDQCYVRYASNFIMGAARIDGEIMETLWAPLNIISPSCRGMSTPHWQECLDYQMNDCNFMKMIRMSIFLCRKYKEAKRGAAESSEAFNKLNETADPDMVTEWHEQETAANASRAEDPLSMDIYEVQLEKAPSRKQVELDILQSQGLRPEAHRRLGAATWIASGITIEESQIALAMDIQKLGRHPTETQELSIAYFDADEDVLDMNLAFVDDDTDAPEDDWEELDIEPSEYRPAEVFCPEITVIPLPSNIGLAWRNELSVTDLVAQEITLREGQANDLLHLLRVHLADKAVLFRTTVRPAKLQARSTRAWAQVHSVEQVIRLNSHIYIKCRQQLVKLEAFGLLEKYRQLDKKDLKTSARVADPNSRGQRNSTLSWFWSFEVQADSTSSDWMTECKVHWLCTKSLRDHWAEELLLVEHEMRWTIDFFIFKSRAWLARAEADAGNRDWDGHKCYAVRQAQVYQELADAADTSFSKVNPEFKWNH